MSSGEAAESDKAIKFLLIGDAYVGKSCFLNMFSDGAVVDDYIATIGVDFASKVILIDNLDVKIQIWDTSGQKRFSTIVSSYFRGAAGIIIMFDITDKKTFDDCHDWLGQVKSRCGDDVQLLLVGNKLDLETERQVELNDAEDFAAKENLEYLEISARDRSDVEGAVIDLARMVRISKASSTNKSDTETALPVSDKEKAQCCTLS